MVSPTKSGFGRAKLRDAREPSAAVTTRVKGQPKAQVFRIAGVQMASGPNVAANLNEAGRLIEIAAQQGARLVALPEYFAIMGMRPADKVKVREKDGDGPVQRFLSQTARKHGIWLIGCSVPMAAPTEGKIYNSCQVYDAGGKMVARYDKIHLFSLHLGKETFEEEGTLEAGKQVKVIDSPFGRIGLSVCYDLRFPELYRAMKDVDIIVVPSAFTETTGRAHWEPLVRARAIENLAYVLAPAQGGYHLSGRETHGDSMVVDPWGTVLDRLPRGSGVVIASVNPAYQASLRKSLPALTHRVIHRI
ncbi:MAG: carbon-nitrogen hydrolase family protein [Betaproteobacteria bacterium]|jgi:predicted amidohydrolase